MGGLSEKPSLPLVNLRVVVRLWQWENCTNATEMHTFGPSCQRRTKTAQVWRAKIAHFSRPSWCSQPLIVVAAAQSRQIVRDRL